LPSKKIRVCWVNGSYYYCNRILSQIKSAIDNPEIYIYGDTTDAEYVENQISENSIFSENRLFILKALPKFSGSDAKSNKRWIALFDSISEDSIVVVYNVDPKKHTAIFKHVSEIGKVFYSSSHMDRGDALSWVNEFFEADGKTIDDEVADLIVESIGYDSEGYDTDKLYICLKKIISYLGKKKKKISKNDILCGVDNYINFVIWDIIGAFESRDFSKCVLLMKNACSKEKSPKDAVSHIFNTLFWKLRLLLFLKEYVANGHSQDSAMQKAKELHKFSKSGAGLYSSLEVELNKGGGMKPVYSDNAISSAFKSFGGRKPSIQCFGRSELFKLVVAQNECMLNIRHESDDIHCIIIAENFFMSSCNILDSQLLEKIRRVPHGGIHSF